MIEEGEIILVISFNPDYEMPGMLPEEKVLPLIFFTCHLMLLA